MNTLTLNIVNLEELQHGVLTRHQFDRNGGTIGSHGANWLMFDRDRRIQPVHCEIRWMEGSFCAIDRCNQTYLNHSSQTLGENAPVRLQEGDELRVGAYRLQVHFQQDRTGEHSLDSLLTPHQRALDALLASAAPSFMDTPHTPAATDICEAFAPGIGHDPLAALNRRLPTKPEEENALQHLLMGELS
ncbi:FHA domain-containing protein [Pseudomonas entomophila]|uniref:FHA domain-containing protein n=1 Tax=Pseudomonas entomophila TaxID=312306 RepID=UPI0023D87440|nr:FHA domain-containing protein [Pseudomonas entomophila]MDF0729254.1 FHA domain-containing protein [Pseudomonas entomophila]